MAITDKILYYGPVNKKNKLIAIIIITILGLASIGLGVLYALKPSVSAGASGVTSVTISSTQMENREVAKGASYTLVGTVLGDDEILDKTIAWSLLTPELATLEPSDDTLTAKLTVLDTDAVSNGSVIAVRATSRVNDKIFEEAQYTVKEILVQGINITEIGGMSFSGGTFEMYYIQNPTEEEMDLVFKPIVVDRESQSGDFFSNVPANELVFEILSQTADGDGDVIQIVNGNVIHSVGEGVATIRVSVAGNPSVYKTFVVHVLTRPDELILYDFDADEPIISDDYFRLAASNDTATAQQINLRNFIKVVPEIAQAKTISELTFTMGKAYDLQGADLGTSYLIREGVLTGTSTKGTVTPLTSNPREGRQLVIISHPNFEPITVTINVYLPPTGVSVNIQPPTGSAIVAANGEAPKIVELSVGATAIMTTTIMSYSGQVSQDQYYDFEYSETQFATSTGQASSLLEAPLYGGYFEYDAFNHSFLALSAGKTGDQDNLEKIIYVKAYSVTNPSVFVLFSIKIGAIVTDIRFNPDSKGTLQSLDYFVSSSTEESDVGGSVNEENYLRVNAIDMRLPINSPVYLPDLLSFLPQVSNEMVIDGWSYPQVMVFPQNTYNIMSRDNGTVNLTIKPRQSSTDFIKLNIVFEDSITKIEFANAALNQTVYYFRGESSQDTTISGLRFARASTGSEYANLNTPNDVDIAINDISGLEFVRQTQSSGNVWHYFIEGDEQAYLSISMSSSFSFKVLRPLPQGITHFVLKFRHKDMPSNIASLELGIAYKIKLSHLLVYETSAERLDNYDTLKPVNLVVGTSLFAMEVPKGKDRFINIVPVYYDQNNTAAWERITLSEVTSSSEAYLFGTEYPYVRFNSSLPDLTEFDISVHTESTANLYTIRMTLKNIVRLVEGFNPETAESGGEAAVDGVVSGNTITYKTVINDEDFFSPSLIIPYTLDYETTEWNERETLASTQTSINENIITVQYSIDTIESGSVSGRINVFARAVTLANPTKITFTFAQPISIGGSTQLYQKVDIIIYIYRNATAIGFLDIDGNQVKSTNTETGTVSEENSVYSYQRYVDDDVDDSRNILLSPKLIAPIAPEGVEAYATTGTLSITVFDADGKTLQDGGNPILEYISATQSLRVRKHNDSAMIGVAFVELCYTDYSLTDKAVKDIFKVLIRYRIVREISAFNVINVQAEMHLGSTQVIDVATQIVFAGGEISEEYREMEIFVDASYSNAISFDTANNTITALHTGEGKLVFRPRLFPEKFIERYIRVYIDVDSYSIDFNSDYATVEQDRIQLAHGASTTAALSFVAPTEQQALLLQPTETAFSVTYLVKSGSDFVEGNGLSISTDVTNHTFSMGAASLGEYKITVSLTRYGTTFDKVYYLTVFDPADKIVFENNSPDGQAAFSFDLKTQLSIILSARLEGVTTKGEVEYTFVGTPENASIKNDNELHATERTVVTIRATFTTGYDKQFSATKVYTVVDTATASTYVVDNLGNTLPQETTYEIDAAQNQVPVKVFANFDLGNTREVDAASIVFYKVNGGEQSQLDKESSDNFVTLNFADYKNITVYATYKHAGLPRVFTTPHVTLVVLQPTVSDIFDVSGVATDSELAQSNVLQGNTVALGVPNVLLLLGATFVYNYAIESGTHLATLNANNLAFNYQTVGGQVRVSLTITIGGLGYNNYVMKYYKTYVVEAAGLPFIDDSTVTQIDAGQQLTLSFEVKGVKGTEPTHTYDKADGDYNVRAYIVSGIDLVDASSISGINLVDEKFTAKAQTLGGFVEVIIEITMQKGAYTGAIITKRIVIRVNPTVKPQVEFASAPTDNKLDAGDVYEFGIKIGKETDNWTEGTLTSLTRDQDYSVTYSVSSELLGTIDSDGQFTANSTSNGGTISVRVLVTILSLTDSVFAVYGGTTFERNYTFVVNPTDAPVISYSTAIEDELDEHGQITITHGDSKEFEASISGIGTATVSFVYVLQDAVDANGKALGVLVVVDDKATFTANMQTLGSTFGLLVTATVHGGVFDGRQYSRIITLAVPTVQMPTLSVDDDGLDGDTDVAQGGAYVVELEIENSNTATYNLVATVGASLVEIVAQTDGEGAHTGFYDITIKSGTLGGNVVLEASAIVGEGAYVNVVLRQTIIFTIQGKTVPTLSLTAPDGFVDLKQANDATGKVTLTATLTGEKTGDFVFDVISGGALVTLVDDDQTDDFVEVKANLDTLGGDVMVRVKANLAAPFVGTEVVAVIKISVESPANKPTFALNTANDTNDPSTTILQQGGTKLITAVVQNATCDANAYTYTVLSGGNLLASDDLTAQNTHQLTLTTKATTTLGGTIVIEAKVVLNAPYANEVLTASITLTVPAMPAYATSLEVDNTVANNIIAQKGSRELTFAITNAAIKTIAWQVVVGGNLLQTIDSTPIDKNTAFAASNSYTLIVRAKDEFTAGGEVVIRAIAVLGEAHNDVQVIEVITLKVQEPVMPALTVTAQKNTDSAVTLTQHQVIDVAQGDTITLDLALAPTTPFDIDVNVLTNSALVTQDKVTNQLIIVIKQNTLGGDVSVSAKATITQGYFTNQHLELVFTLRVAAPIAPVFSFTTSFDAEYEHGDTIAIATQLTGGYTHSVSLSLSNVLDASNNTLAYLSGNTLHINYQTLGGTFTLVATASITSGAYNNTFITITQQIEVASIPVPQWDLDGIAYAITLGNGVTQAFSGIKIVTVQPNGEGEDDTVTTLVGGNDISFAIMGDLSKIGTFDAETRLLTIFDVTQGGRFFITFYYTFTSGSPYNGLTMRHDFEITVKALSIEVDQTVLLSGSSANVTAFIGGAEISGANLDNLTFKVLTEKLPDPQNEGQFIDGPSYGYMSDKTTFVGSNSEFDEDNQIVRVEATYTEGEGDSLVEYKSYFEVLVLNFNIHITDENGSVVSAGSSIQLGRKLDFQITNEGNAGGISLGVVEGAELGTFSGMSFQIGNTNIGTVSFVASYTNAGKIYQYAKLLSFTIYNVTEVDYFIERNVNTITNYIVAPSSASNVGGKYYAKATLSDKHKVDPSAEVVFKVQMTLRERSTNGSSFSKTEYLFTNIYNLYTNLKINGVTISDPYLSNFGKGETISTTSQIASDAYLSISFDTKYNSTYTHSRIIIIATVNINGVDKFDIPVTGGVLRYVPKASIITSSGGNASHFDQLSFDLTNTHAGSEFYSSSSYNFVGAGTKIIATSTLDRATANSGRYNANTAGYKVLASASNGGAYVKSISYPSDQASNVSSVEIEFVDVTLPQTVIIQYRRYFYGYDGYASPTWSVSYRLIPKATVTATGKVNLDAGTIYAVGESVNFDLAGINTYAYTSKIFSLVSGSNLGSMVNNVFTPTAIGEVVIGVSYKVRSTTYSTDVDITFTKQIRLNIVNYVFPLSVAMTSSSGNSLIKNASATLSFSYPGVSIGSPTASFKHDSQTNNSSHATIGTVSFDNAQHKASVVFTPKVAGSFVVEISYQISGIGAVFTTSTTINVVDLPKIEFDAGAATLAQGAERTFGVVVQNYLPTQYSVKYKIVSGSSLLSASVTLDGSGYITSNPTNKIVAKNDTLGGTIVVAAEVTFNASAGAFNGIVITDTKSIEVTAPIAPSFDVEAEVDGTLATHTNGSFGNVGAGQEIEVAPISDADLSDYSFTFLSGQSYVGNIDDTTTAGKLTFTTQQAPENVEIVILVSAKIASGAYAGTQKQMVVRFSLQSVSSTLSWNLAGIVVDETDDTLTIDVPDNGNFALATKLAVGSNDNYTIESVVYQIVSSDEGISLQGNALKVSKVGSVTLRATATFMVGGQRLSATSANLVISFTKPTSVSGVEDAITAISTTEPDTVANLTAYKTAVNAAQALYEALTPTLKGLVDNYAILETAQARVTSLQAAQVVKEYIDLADTAASNASADDVASINNFATALSTAQNSYDALPNKTDVSNRARLTTLQDLLADLRAANAVYDLIVAIPDDYAADLGIADILTNLTTVEGYIAQAIEARAAYDALTPTQLALLSGDAEILAFEQALYTAVQDFALALDVNSNNYTALKNAYDAAQALYAQVSNYHASMDAVDIDAQFALVEQRLQQLSGIDAVVALMDSLEEVDNIVIDNLASVKTDYLWTLAQYNALTSQKQTTLQAIATTAYNKFVAVGARIDNVEQVIAAFALVDAVYDTVITSFATLEKSHVENALAAYQSAKTAYDNLGALATEFHDADEYSDKLSKVSTALDLFEDLLQLEADTSIVWYEAETGLVGVSDFESSASGLSSRLTALETLHTTSHADWTNILIAAEEMIELIVDTTTAFEAIKDVKNYGPVEDYADVDPYSTLEPTFKEAVEAAEEAFRLLSEPAEQQLFLQAYYNLHILPARELLDKLLTAVTLMQKIADGMSIISGIPEGTVAQNRTDLQEAIAAMEAQYSQTDPLALALRLEDYVDERPSTVEDSYADTLDLFATYLDKLEKGLELIGLLDDVVAKMTVETVAQYDALQTANYEANAYKNTHFNGVAWPFNANGAETFVKSLLVTAGDTTTLSSYMTNTLSNAQKLINELSPARDVYDLVEALVVATALPTMAEVEQVLAARAAYDALVEGNKLDIDLGKLTDAEQAILDQIVAHFGALHQYTPFAPDSTTLSAMLAPLKTLYEAMDASEESDVANLLVDIENRVLSNIGLSANQILTNAQNKVNEVGGVARILEILGNFTDATQVTLDNFDTPDWNGTGKTALALIQEMTNTYAALAEPIRANFNVAYPSQKTKLLALQARASDLTSVKAVFVEIDALHDEIENFALANVVDKRTAYDTARANYVALGALLDEFDDTNEYRDKLDAINTILSAIELVYALADPNNVWFETREGYVLLADFQDAVVFAEKALQAVAGSYTPVTDVQDALDVANARITLLTSVLEAYALVDTLYADLSSFTLANLSAKRNDYTTASDAYTALDTVEGTNAVFDIESARANKLADINTVLTALEAIKPAVNGLVLADIKLDDIDTLTAKRDTITTEYAKITALGFSYTEIADWITNIEARLSVLNTVKDVFDEIDALYNNIESFDFDNWEEKYQEFDTVRDRFTSNLASIGEFGTSTYVGKLNTLNSVFDTFGLLENLITRRGNILHQQSEQYSSYEQTLTAIQNKISELSEASISNTVLNTKLAELLEDEFEYVKALMDKIEEIDAYLSGLTDLTTSAELLQLVIQLEALFEAPISPEMLGLYNQGMTIDEFYIQKIDYYNQFANALDLANQLVASLDVVDLANTTITTVAGYDALYSALQTAIAQYNTLMLDSNGNQILNLSVGNGATTFGEGDGGTTISLRDRFNTIKTSAEAVLAPLADAKAAYDLIEALVAVTALPTMQEVQDVLAAREAYVALGGNPLNIDTNKLTTAEAAIATYVATEFNTLEGMLATATDASALQTKYNSLSTLKNALSSSLANEVNTQLSTSMQDILIATQLKIVEISGVDRLLQILGNFTDSTEITVDNIDTEWGSTGQTARALVAQASGIYSGFTSAVKAAFDTDHSTKLQLLHDLQARITAIDSAIALFANIDDLYNDIASFAFDNYASKKALAVEYQGQYASYASLDTLNRNLKLDTILEAIAVFEALDALTISFATITEFDAELTAIQAAYGVLLAKITPDVIAAVATKILDKKALSADYNAAEYAYTAISAVQVVVVTDVTHITTLELAVTTAEAEIDSLTAEQKALLDLSIITNAKTQIAEYKTYVALQTAIDAVNGFASTTPADVTDAQANLQGLLDTLAQKYAEANASALALTSGDKTIQALYDEALALGNSYKAKLDKAVDLLGKLNAIDDITTIATVAGYNTYVADVTAMRALWTAEFTDSEDATTFALELVIADGSATTLTAHYEDVNSAAAIIIDQYAQTKAVSDLIAALPTITTPTLAQILQVVAAREAYDALGGNPLNIDITKLTTAETAIATYVAEEFENLSTSLATATEASALQTIYNDLTTLKGALSSSLANEVNTQLSTSMQDILNATQTKLAEISGVGRLLQILGKFASATEVTVDNIDTADWNNTGKTARALIAEATSIYNLLQGSVQTNFDNTDEATLLTDLQDRVTYLDKVKMVDLLVASLSDPSAIDTATLASYQAQVGMIQTFAYGQGVAIADISTTNQAKWQSAATRISELSDVIALLNIPVPVFANFAELDGFVLTNGADIAEISNLLSSLSAVLTDAEKATLNTLSKIKTDHAAIESYHGEIVTLLGGTPSVGDVATKLAEIATATTSGDLTGNQFTSLLETPLTTWLDTEVANAKTAGLAEVAQLLADMTASNLIYSMTAYTSQLTTWLGDKVTNATTVEQIAALIADMTTVNDNNILDTYIGDLEDKLTSLVDGATTVADIADLMVNMNTHNTDDILNGYLTTLGTNLGALVNGATSVKDIANYLAILENKSNIVLFGNYINTLQGELQTKTDNAISTGLAKVAQLLADMTASEPTYSMTAYTSQLTIWLGDKVTNATTGAEIAQLLTEMTTANTNSNLDTYITALQGKLTGMVSAAIEDNFYDAIELLLEIEDENSGALDEYIVDVAQSLVEAAQISGDIHDAVYLLQTIDFIKVNNEQDANIKELAEYITNQITAVQIPTAGILTYANMVISILEGYTEQGDVNTYITDLQTYVDAQIGGVISNNPDIVDALGLLQALHNNNDGNKYGTKIDDLIDVILAPFRSDTPLPSEEVEQTIQSVITVLAILESFEGEPFDEIANELTTWLNTQIDEWIAEAGTTLAPVLTQLDTAVAGLISEEDYAKLAQLFTDALEIANAYDDLAALMQSLIMPTGYSEGEGGGTPQDTNANYLQAIEMLAALERLVNSFNSTYSTDIDFNSAVAPITAIINAWADGYVDSVVAGFETGITYTVIADVEQNFINVQAYLYSSVWSSEDVRIYLLVVKPAEMAALAEKYTYYEDANSNVAELVLISDIIASLADQPDNYGTYGNEANFAQAVSEVLDYLDSTPANYVLTSVLGIADVVSLQTELQSWYTEYQSSQQPPDEEFGGGYTEQW